MKNYILKRLILLIPILIGITIITFLIIHLTPGDFTKINMQMDTNTSVDSISRLRQLYGLDKQLHIQYFEWLKRFIKLDFGESFIDNRPVMDKILERLPATLLLNIVSLFFIFFLGIIIGVTSAIKRNSFYDRTMMIFTFIGYSVPAFWLALILMMLFGVKLGWLPISGMKSIGFEQMNLFEKVSDITLHMVLPVFITSFGGLAYISRYVKSSMVETLSQQYIKATYAKGLTQNKIIYKCALKNSLLPVITLFGLSLPGLIGGSFIFETIFAWPGMGRLAYDAAMSFDYPVIMGVVTIAAFFTMVGNLIADILYAVVDPRIRYK